MSDNDDTRLSPAPWLSRARAQSQALADERVRRARPFAGEIARSAERHHGAGRHPLALAIAAVLALLLVASGAWALVVRARRAEEKAAPSVPAAVEIGAPVRVRASAATTPVVPPSAAASIARRRGKNPSPSPSPPTSTPANAGRSSGAVTFDDAEGDLIIVAPHEKQPPLFSPEEWKRRRARAQ